MSLLEYKPNTINLKKGNMNYLTIVNFLVQTNITSKLNEVLSNYGVPIVIFIIVISGVYGVVSNLDKIMDSDGRGTRKEGIMNVIYIMGGVILAVAIIAGIISIAKGVTMSI